MNLTRRNPQSASCATARSGRSLSIDLAKGTWYDHEVGEGGGALDLVTRETKLTGEERLDWLKQHGFVFGTIQPNGGERASIVATYDYVDEGGKLLPKRMKTSSPSRCRRCKAASFARSSISVTQRSKN